MVFSLERCLLFSDDRLDTDRFDPEWFEMDRSSLARWELLLEPLLFWDICRLQAIHIGTFAAIVAASDAVAMGLVAVE